MKIKASLTEKQWIKAYISIWSTMFKLTEKERDIMGAIISHHLDLKSKVTDESLYQELFMSVKAKKEIKEELGMSDQLFTNYLSSLTTKRALISENQKYTINAKLIPLKELVFEFNVIEDEANR